MRYYLDTEFIERPNTIELISLALVREDGLELYFVNGESDFTTANDWVRANVLPNLAHPELGGIPCLPLRSIAKSIREFVGADPKPIFYGYYADYDWVVFCWLFGAMVDLPSGFPMYCRDIKQYVDDVWDATGIDLAAQVVVPENAHNALIDARHAKQIHDCIIRWSSQQHG